LSIKPNLIYFTFTIFYRFYKHIDITNNYYKFRILLKVLKRMPRVCYLCLTEVKFIKNVNIEKNQAETQDNVLKPLSSIMGQLLKVQN